MVYNGSGSVCVLGIILVKVIFKRDKYLDLIIRLGVKSLYFGYKVSSV